MDSPPELSPDLLETQEYFQQYFETAELRWQQLKECEVKIGRLEDEIRTFEQRENDWKERNEQSQALILTQLEHINELTQDSINAHDLKKTLEAKELMYQVERSKLETERDATVCALETERKILIEKHERESAVLAEKLAFLEQEKLETSRKTELERSAMIEDFSAKIAQNGMEISQLTAKHAVENERLTETIEDYKRMLFDHREKMNALINTHQKALAETGQYFGQETNSLKQEIHSLQNQLNQQIRKNVALNDELQRSNKIREELSVRLRAEREIQNKLKDAPGFHGARSRPLQESSFGNRVSLPSPILTAAHPFDTGRTLPTPATSFSASSHLLPPREDTGDPGVSEDTRDPGVSEDTRDPGVSEVTDALALQSLSSQSRPEKPKAGDSVRRSFVGGGEPSGLSDEENASSYPMKIKRKKLFSEDSTRFL